MNFEPHKRAKGQVGCAACERIVDFVRAELTRARKAVQP